MTPRPRPICAQAADGAQRRGGRTALGSRTRPEVPRRARIAYGAGLRVSEVAGLKIDGIDSTRMLIRIEEGKGRKDRNAMLSPQLLKLLRLWWREGRRRGVMLPHGWLFSRPQSPGARPQRRNALFRA